MWTSTMRVKFEYSDFNILKVQVKYMYISYLYNDDNNQYMCVMKNKMKRKNTKKTQLNTLSAYEVHGEDDGFKYQFW